MAEEEEKNETLEYYMSIVNPAMYKEYHKQKNTTVHEVSSWKEDMTEDDFIAMSNKAHKQFSPAMLAQSIKRSNEQTSKGPLPMSMQHVAPVQNEEPDVANVPLADQPLFNLADKSTWKRPPGVPQMRQTGTPSFDEDDDLPVTLTKRE